MERKAWFLGIVLGFLVFVVIDIQRIWSDRMNMHREEVLIHDGLSSEEGAESGNNESPAYVEAYTEFLSRETIDEGYDFPIRGYYLFDLNFDGIPELGILHDSWGSMGGYFTCYYFDGNGITAILNDRGEPMQISNYTQILADYEQEKVYLLKEMYLLQGNENGTYGYVREIKSEGQVPCVYDILNLEVNQQSDLKSHLGTQYAGEDAFLSAPELEDCLITQRYSGKEWVTVSSSEYLKQKRELIPKENSFVDLRDGDLNYLSANYDDNGGLLYTDVKMGKEEMEELFGRFEKSLK
ncbi:MAG: hypothetical protein NC251_09595 [Lachnoclostridium sp.]|nr:hypothetical protein [Lachnospira sp.]MCM1248672.1 hypothetical protein [Lachnoclostridium sp.]